MKDRIIVTVPKNFGEQNLEKLKSRLETLTGEGAFTSVYEVMNQWGANHGAIAYGHIGAKLITLASMLRIPVNMHNVPDEQVFRPKAWSAFGTRDLEGADFRACDAYGPLYG